MLFIFPKAIIFAPLLKKSIDLIKTFQYYAGVAKLVDALDLGSSAARHGGSSPSARTRTKCSTSHAQCLINSILF